MAKKKDESTLLGVSENTARNLANYQAGYQEGERVQNAYNEYSNLKANAPQAYVSPFQQQLDTLYEQIANRQPFKYNLNGDMLYQNAKEQYQQLGKQAMVDTIGQATQLTGGYGNSYAQNAGNQAYQQYLLKLNEQIPTYQNLAMQRYQMEGDQLNNQYGLLRDRENEAYGRYRDTVSDYNNNLSMAYNVYNNERDNDYGRYADALNYWQNQAGAENKDYWTQTNFDYQAQQDALSQANWERQFAWEQQKAQQELAYKYAALAQSRANAAAKEEAERKQRLQDKKDKQEEIRENNLGQKILIHGKNGGRTTEGVSIGLGSMVQNIAAKLAANPNDPSITSPEYSVHGLGGPSADMGKVFDFYDSYKSKARSEDEFVNNLLDSVEWYVANGNFNEDQMERILRHYGLTKD